MIIRGLVLLINHAKDGRRLLGHRYDESPPIQPPHTFNPDRFIKDGKLDPSFQDPCDQIFGFGRRCGPVALAASLVSLRWTEPPTRLSFCRICPGRFFALRTIFLNIACILTLFDIEAPLDGVLEPKFSEDSIMRYVIISQSPSNCSCTFPPVTTD